MDAHVAGAGARVALDWHGTPPLQRSQMTEGRDVDVLVDGAWVRGRVVEGSVAVVRTKPHFRVVRTDGLQVRDVVQRGGGERLSASFLGGPGKTAVLPCGARVSCTPATRAGYAVANTFEVVNSMPGGGTTGTWFDAAEGEAVIAIEFPAPLALNRIDAFPNKASQDSYPSDFGVAVELDDGSRVALPGSPVDTSGWPQGRSQTFDSLPARPVRKIVVTLPNNTSGATFGYLRVFLAAAAGDAKPSAGALLSQRLEAVSKNVAAFFPDVELVAQDGSRVPAHRMVLAVADPTLRDVLARSEGDLALGVGTGAGLEVVRDFLYRGELPTACSTEALLGIGEAAAGLPLSASAKTALAGAAIEKLMLELDVDAAMDLVLSGPSPVASKMLAAVLAVHIDQLMTHPRLPELWQQAPGVAQEVFREGKRLL